MSANVEAVCAASTHGFAKARQFEIELVAGRGVKGDAHFGETVQHLFDRRRNRSKANLRQVHLVEAELFDALRPRGISIGAGELGENIVTRGLSLDGLPQGAMLHLGDEAVVSITGLREPCIKIDRFRKGLRAAVTRDGVEIRKSVRQAVMAVVVRSGRVMPGDGIHLEYSKGPYVPLCLV